jgi:hypothetical protein
MEIVWHLLVQHSITSYRRFFYKKIAIKIAFYIFTPYLIFALIQGSLLVKEMLYQKNWIVDFRSIRYLTSFLMVDLAIKLIFNKLSIINVLPYLSLKIPKSSIINLIILCNHLKILSLLSLMLFIPIWIIMRDILIPLALLVLLLNFLLGILLNNYLSMIFSLSFAAFRLIKVVLALIFNSLLILYLLIWNHVLIPYYAMFKYELMFSISFGLLIWFTHQILRKEIQNLLYLA